VLALTKDVSKVGCGRRKPVPLRILPAIETTGMTNTDHTETDCAVCHSAMAKAIASWVESKASGVRLRLLVGDAGMACAGSSLINRTILDCTYNRCSRLVLSKFCCWFLSAVQWLSNAQIRQGAWVLRKIFSDFRGALRRPR